MNKQEVKEVPAQAESITTPKQIRSRVWQAT